MSFGCLWTYVDFIPLSVYPRSGRPHRGAQCHSIGAGNIGGATSRFQGASDVKNCKRLYNSIAFSFSHLVAS